MKPQHYSKQAHMRPVDQETRTLLMLFLAPVLEQATDWANLAEELTKRGYDLDFEDGRLVISDSYTGVAVCCGSDVGHPLKKLVERLGRPKLRADHTGHFARLS